MSNPESESEEEMTFEQKVLKSTLQKLEKLLDELTAKAFVNNEIKVMLQNLEQQLDSRNYLNDAEKALVKSMLDYANYAAIDIEDYVDYANRFFSEIREEGLDLPYIKLKLEGIYIQMWSITERIWSLEAIYYILCMKEHLCDEIQHHKMWYIYRTAEYAMYEIFTYLTNL
ncbi:MAG: hypothetical protein QXU98_03845 [Candidatus Parvarchaeota archaeon]